MNASPFAANSSLSLDVNFLPNNYYVFSSFTMVDEKFGLAGILFVAVIILHKLVCQMISWLCSGSLARSASKSEFVPELPDDILMEILVRLPVSSIFLFKSVSRSFRSLVLECHTCNRLPPVLVGVFCVSARDWSVSYVSLRKGFGDSSMDYNDPTRFLEESSLYYGIKDCKFGLILCRKSWVSKVIYLCNPATKKCRSIACNVSYCHFVLAYDPSRSKHHYEVIKISQTYESDGYIFEVFSSKTGRWDRKLSITDCCINLTQHSCFANGLLYMFERCFSCLFAINCVDGSYKKVTLPSFNRCEKVGVLCNSYGSLMYAKLCGGELSVWTLLKNENASCWVLRHKINLKDKLEKIGFSYPFDTHCDGFYERTLLFHLDTIVLRINHIAFFYNFESDQLQADTSTTYGGHVLPWSPCYYAVAGL